jgi:hypothetical protein
MVVATAVTLGWKPLGIRHDQALLLECGRRLAAGDWPYRDFFEINPPLIMYFTAVPAFAARMLDANPIPAFNLALILLAGWSAWRVLAIAGGWEPLALLDRAALAAPALMLAAVQPDPGQREHLFFLLYYPFLILRAGRWSGRPLPAYPWAYGIAAAAGVALKPYFLIAVVAPEIALALRRRRWRPLVAAETLAAVCTGGVYLLHFLVLPRDVSGPFFDRILPLVLAGYRAYDPPFSIVLIRGVRRAVVAAALLALLWRLARRGVGSGLVWPAGAFAFAALLTALAQRKGFSYHFLPVDQTLLLLLALAGVGAVRKWIASARTAAMAAALATLAILISPIVQVARGEALSRWAPLVERISEPGDPVLILSTSVTYAHPAILQTGRRVGSRHLSAALIVMAIEAGRRGMAGAERLEAQTIDEVKQDLRQLRPAAVLIDRQPGCHGCPPGFRLLDYLERRGLLEAMASSYRYAGDEGGLAIYLVQ